MGNEVNITIRTKTAGEQAVRQLAGDLTSAFQKGRLMVTAFNEAAGRGHGLIQGLTRQTKELVGAYIGIQAAQSAFRGMLDIVRENEKAQFLLSAAVQSANREFRNTGSLENWQDRIEEMKKELLVFEDGALQKAVAGTIEMTKELGLSADQMEEVVRRTAEISAGRMDLSQGIEITTKALMGQGRAAHQLGLTMRDEYVEAWYEAHKVQQMAWKDLDDTSKAQVRYQIFLEQTNAALGRSKEYAKTFSGALDMIKVAIDDAVGGHEELNEAMQKTAKWIAENADKLGAAATMLLDLTVAVTKFTIEWKEVLIGFAAAYAAGKAVLYLTGVIKGLGAAIAILKGTELAAALSKIATTAGLAAVGLSGGLALAAGIAAAAMPALIDMLVGASKAEAELAKQRERNTKFTSKAEAEARKLGASLGFEVHSMDEFLDLTKQGAVIWDENTASWKRNVEAMDAHGKQIGITKEQLKSLNDTISTMGAGYAAVSEKVRAAFDFAAERTQFLALGEKEAAEKVIAINRAKAATIIYLAQQEAARKLESIQQSQASEQQAAELVKKIHEALAKDKIKALGDYRSALTSSLSTLKSQIDQEKNAQDASLKQAKTAETEKLKIRRETNQLIEKEFVKGLSEQDAYDAQVLMNLDKVSEAQRRVFFDPEKAKDLLVEAKQFFVGLGKAPEGAVWAGTEFTGVLREIGDGLEDLADQDYEKATDEADAHGRKVQELTDLYEKLKTELDGVGKKIADAHEAMVQAAQEGVEWSVQVDTSEADAAIERLQQPTESVHTVRMQTIQESASGGLVGWAVGPRAGVMARGGRLPGWGGGDRIRALLEAGEFVIRKEAVKRYGTGLFEMLNSLKLSLPRLPAAVLPAIRNPQSAMGFAGGGMVGAPSRTVNLNLNIGGETYPMIGDDQVAAALERHLRRLEKTK